MNYQLLLVDDESVDLEWLTSRVNNHYDRLDIAAAVNSSFKALNVLQEQHVDILLSDIRMPIMCGLELAAQARELQPHIKIAFISGHEEFSYARQALRVKASSYLLKPVNDRELNELIQELIATLDIEHEHDVPTGKLPDASEKPLALHHRHDRMIIDMVMEEVAANLSRTTLKEIAEKLGFSPNYLGHLFQKKTGQSFSDYVIQCRLRRSCQLLLDPLMRIYEVADQLGYKNVLYFNRQFKKHMGLTPSEYRKKNKV